jgi:hypothetical protein
VDQSQIGHIARILYRISDNDERDEVTREIAQVLKKAEPNFNQHRFYELASVAFMEEQ